MNNFTKEELESLMNCVIYSSWHDKEKKYVVINKIQSTIDNYFLPENVDLIVSGQLLFNDHNSLSAILHHIHKQLELCNNNDETKFFRIDWKIIYGYKFKNE